MKKEIKAVINGRAIIATSGTTLSEIIRGEKPCGGHGKCGKCKVKAKGKLSPLADSELKLLTSEEIANGVRLSCLTFAEGDCEIETLSDTLHTTVLTDSPLPNLTTDFLGYGVAIDIGTTTLAARLYGKNFLPLAEASRLNPQEEFGADVISRIEASISGKAELLANSVRAALNEMLKDLAKNADISPREIDSVVITGNTVMLSLLTKEDVEPFSHAPFQAKRLFGETIKAAALALTSLSPETPVYLPPSISAFVGADTTCAILATKLCEGEIAFLVDIGTNGEMALWDGKKLTVCSTAAGPAFEGVGISSGMRGAVGAIDKVSLHDEKLSAHVIGDTAPVGICGSGLVDAVACMLESEILDESGYLEDDEFVIAPPVTLTPRDIRMLQTAKSAICAGLVTLVKTSGINADEISKLCIAGGFGNYLNTENAVKIGLLPRELASKIETVGNAALSGATALLAGETIREIAAKLSKNAHTLELSSNPTFSELYMSGMMLEECNI